MNDEQENSPIETLEAETETTLQTTAPVADAESQSETETIGDPPDSEYLPPT